MIDQEMTLTEKSEISVQYDQPTTLEGGIEDKPLSNTMMMMAEKMAYLFSSWLCFSVAVQGKNQEFSHAKR